MFLLAFVSGNNQFEFLSSFLLMCVTQLTLKLTDNDNHREVQIPREK